ncbi:hypothetical protein Y032_0374g202 [Ancylostoma ceylanicum]|nr:hypothetical protein Y032_0374g202 [Ancylostoma ceylanicum]
MVSHLAEVSITFVVVCLCFIGLLGNFALLTATVIYKELHHKISFIVAVLTCLHVVCLLSELYMEALQLRFHPITRLECFRHTLIYEFAMLAQSSMFFMLWMDYLLAIIIPLKHRFFTTVTYVFTMCLPPFVIAGIAIILVSVNMDSDPIEFCTPITMIPVNTEWILYVINGLNVAALLLNVINFLTLKYRGRDPALRLSVSSHGSHKSDIKLMRSFILMAWVFVCSWCLSVSSTLIAVRLLPKEISSTALTYIVVLALPTYCQGYFVTYSRSARYRKAYRKLQHLIFPWIVSPADTKPSTDNGSKGIASSL